MFRNNKSATASNTSKFCKVCLDAGKTEAEYRSHFTRETSEQNSKVVCPTLLKQECRYCYKNGHTIKYCPTLKEKERCEKRLQYSAKDTFVSKATTNKAQKNVFACLECDSDEEKRVHKNTGTKTKEEFPALGAPSKNEHPVATNSYASVLAAPAPKPVTNAPKVVLPSVPVPTKLTIATTATLVNPWADNNPKRVTRLNWAAMDSDSEDDEEEDEEEEDEEEEYVDATW